ncbi:MAG: hypothetical protein ABIQ62_04495 [Thermomonas sp.]
MRLAGLVTAGRTVAVILFWGCDGYDKAFAGKLAKQSRLNHS